MAKPTPFTSLSVKQYPDAKILCLWAALLSIGLVMVASSSIAFAAANYGDAWYFLKRHLVFLIMSLAGAVIVLVTPSRFWRTLAPVLLLLAVVLLALVLVPGVGRQVNGAQRWISFGFFAVQISEIAKFAIIIFFADYFASRSGRGVTDTKDFLRVIGVLAVVLALLVAEPDFGSTVVIGATVAAMMFVAGVKLRYLMPLIIVTTACFAALAMFSPYRMLRLVTFLDPWADQFNSGYQLTQSLIAFGRGEWWGVGLGNSLQKLFYLPEAHTDFIFAVMAEEIGLVGGLLVLALFVALIMRMWRVADVCVGRGEAFLGYVVYAVAVLFSLQVFINVGVASGLLPTKGLTLPFISYGGSSLIVSSALMALVLRADIEMRQVSEPKTVVTNPSRVRAERSRNAEAAA